MPLTLKTRFPPRPQSDAEWRHEASLRRAFFAALDAQDAAALERVLKDSPEAVQWKESMHLLGMHNHYGISPLHIAVWLGDTASTAVLLGAGADPNCRNRDGAGVIHYAALRGCTKVAKLLIEAGADPGLRHGTGNTTPLIQAALAKNPEMVELLLYYGANAHDTDCDKQTALSRARKYENNESTIMALEQAVQDGYGQSYARGLEKKAAVMKPLTLR